MLTRLHNAKVINIQTHQLHSSISNVQIVQHCAHKYSNINLVQKKMKKLCNAMSVLKLVSVKKAVSDISISDGALHLSFAMVLLNSNKR